MKMNTKTPETTFERREIKYILTQAQKAAFMQAVESYLHPDENGTGGNYQLMSLYFDSPRKDFYRSRWFRLPVRKKLRIRRYITSDTTLWGEEKVFIEIKEHTETINYKRRVLLSVDDTFKLLNGDKLEASFSPEDQEIIDEISSIVAEFQITPSAVTSYIRQAYKVKKQDWWIRITFDHNIRFRTDHLGLEWRGEKDKNLIDEGLEIMEIKVKGELPEWTQKALESCGIEQVSFSKYAHALEQGLGDELVPSVEIMEHGELFQDHKKGLLPAEIWKQRKLWSA